MKILFFSPHAYLTVHAIPEAIVIEALKKRGHEVVTVNCDGALSSYCICMNAAGLAPQASMQEKNAICKTCRKRRDLIRNEFGIPSKILDKFIEKDDEQAIQNIISNIRPENYAELTWMDIPVGRYALYEFILNNKLNSLSLNIAEWDEYKIYLHNTFIAAFAGRRILDEIKPDVIATYNSLYSVNHVFCALAEQRGITHYTLHAGSHIKRRYSTMTIFKGLLASLLIARNKSWREISNIPISLQQVHVVAEHIEELLKGMDPWVYSIASSKASSESLKEYFGISNDKQILLATMASGDERFAADTIDALPPFVEPMFPTQIDWISALIKFVRQRDDLFLIIRVHPRDFPNKREQVKSKQSLELQKLFVNLPNNIRVNWPWDQISLHDLIKITDVGLNATSTTGIEFGMFGVPVVLYDSKQLFSYPPEINHVAANPDDYYQKIEQALQDGWSFENVRKVFRWLSYKFERVAIDISDGYGMTTESSFIDTGSKERGYDGLWSWFQGKIFKNAQIVIRSFENFQKCLMVKLHINGYFEARQEARKLIGQIKNRAIPVKNSELLCIAIEKNLASHLDLPNETQHSQPTLEEETNAIRDQVRNLFQTILPGDSSDEFAYKMKHVLSG